VAGSKVETVFTAKDKTSATIKGLDKQLGGLQASAVGLASMLGGGYMVARIGQAAWELGKLGAQSLDTKDSFASMMSSVGLTTAMLDRMRKASGGTVDDLSLMQGANLALAGTSGKLAAAMAEAQPQMLEIARAAYKMNPALGSVDFLYQSLNTGIKRNSKMLIDNLGIVVNQTELQRNFAASIGKTVEQLTQQEQQLALLQGVLAGGETLKAQVGGVDAMGDSFARMDTAISNLKMAIGEQLAPAIASLAGNLALLISGEKDLWDESVAVEKAQQDVARATRTVKLAQDMGIPIWEEYAKKELATAQASLDATTAQFGLTKAVKDGAIVAGASIGPWADYANNQIALTNALVAARAEAEKTTGWWAKSATGQTVGPATIGMYTPEGAQKFKDWQTQLAADEEKLREDSARDTASKVLDVWESAYRDQRSMIEGIMQPTQSFDSTKILDALGQHTDTWDEAARRMADVANRGADSPWAKIMDIPPDVLAAGGDKLKGYAATWVGDFYAGLHPEAVDKEAIKDRVRDLITGGANMEQLVSEIAAEMGGVDKTLVQKALGVFDPIQAGIDAARDTLDDSEDTIGGLGNSFMGYLTKGAVEGTAMTGFVDAIVAAIVAALSDTET
jgi:hypothetical protein